jgi:dephospho-CoA kinase
MERDNMTESEAKAALGAQTDRATRLAAADDLIDNSGDFERLNEQVDRLHTRYVAMTRDCPKS